MFIFNFFRHFPPARSSFVSLSPKSAWSPTECCEENTKPAVWTTGTAGLDDTEQQNGKVNHIDLLQQYDRFSAVN